MSCHGMVEAGFFTGASISMISNLSSNIPAWLA
jgi:hypothetical protein